MKKVILLSALAFGTITVFAQSQKTTATNAQAPVTNLTANAVATPVQSAPVQNISATMHDLKKSEAAPNAQKQPVKKTETKKASGNTEATKSNSNASK